MTEHEAIEELAALLDGEGRADDAPESLGALVALAETVRDTTELAEPTPHFRTALRAELVAAADHDSLTDRLGAWWGRRTAGLRATGRVAVATVTASGLIGSAGVAAAAQQALPGELLYGVKGATEQARLLLATDDVAEARLHLAFAQERMEELEALRGQLDADEVVALLHRMDESSRRGAEALLEAVAAGAIRPEEVRAFTDQQRDRLTAMFNDLPLPARPQAEDSLELLRRIRVNVATALPPAPAGPPDPFPFPGDRSERSDAPVVPPVPLDRDTVEDLVGDVDEVVEEPLDLFGGGDADGDDEPAAEDRDDSDDNQDEDEPFRPSGPLTDGPEADDEPEDDTDPGLLEELDDSLESTTGSEVDTEVVDRAADSVDEGIDLDGEDESP